MKADFITGTRTHCVYCGSITSPMIDPHSGMIDWGSYFDGGDPADFGCGNSPETDDEGSGSHSPGPGCRQVGEFPFADRWIKSTPLPGGET